MSITQPTHATVDNKINRGNKLRENGLGVRDDLTVSRRAACSVGWVGELGRPNREAAGFMSPLDSRVRGNDNTA